MVYTNSILVNLELNTRRNMNVERFPTYYAFVVSFYLLQTAVLGVFYIIAIGVGLRISGYLINLINDNHPYVISLNDGLTSYRLLFAGSFLTSLFWVSTAYMNVYFSGHYVAYICVYVQAVVQAMWPWYATGMETEEELAEDRKVI